MNYKNELQQLSQEAKLDKIKEIGEDIFFQMKEEIKEYAKRSGLTNKRVQCMFSQGFKKEIISYIIDKFKHIDIECKYVEVKGDIYEPLSYDQEYFVIDWSK
jgi:hypothetical protein